MAYFMEVVQQYDCLYNRFSRDYKNKSMEVNCWTAIGENFDMSAGNDDKKYKNTKIAYGRSLVN